MRWRSTAGRSTPTSRRVSANCCCGCRRCAPSARRSSNNSSSSGWSARRPSRRSSETCSSAAPTSTGPTCPPCRTPSPLRFLLCFFFVLFFLRRLHDPSSSMRSHLLHTPRTAIRFGTRFVIVFFFHCKFRSSLVWSSEVLKSQGRNSDCSLAPPPPPPADHFWLDPNTKVKRQQKKVKTETGPSGFASKSAARSAIRRRSAAIGNRLV